MDRAHARTQRSITASKTAEDVSKIPEKLKPPNSPIGAKTWCRGGADAPTAHRGVTSIEINTKTTKIARKKCRSSPAMRNSPLKVEIEMAKRPEQWKHISIDRNGAYVPQNALIEVLGIRIQRIVFGRSTEVLGTGRGQDGAAGGRDGKCNGSTISKNNDSSNQVAAARLTEKGQQVCSIAEGERLSSIKIFLVCLGETSNNAIWRRNDLPLSPEPLTNHRRPFYGVSRPSRRR